MIDLQAKEKFINLLESQTGIETLFEYILDVHFWVKNAQFHFVMGNQAVSEKCGCASEEEILGKTDYDFFHQDIADKFRKDDEEIIKSGKPVVNQIELVPNEDGTVDWYTTNKIPIYGKDGSIIGIAGTTRKYQKAEQNVHPYPEMVKVLEYISNHYAEPIKREKLAEMAGFSLNLFEKKFKKAFLHTPEKFINAVRVRAACKALVSTRKSMKIIAFESGFCNQSYFSKQFRFLMGISPKSYRDRYFKGD